MPISFLTIQLQFELQNHVCSRGEVPKKNSSDLLMIYAMVTTFLYPLLDGWGAFSLSTNSRPARDV